MAFVAKRGIGAEEGDERMGIHVRYNWLPLVQLRVEVKALSERSVDRQGLGSFDSEVTATSHVGHISHRESGWKEGM